MPPSGETCVCNVAATNMAKARISPNAGIAPAARLASRPIQKDLPRRILFLLLCAFSWAQARQSIPGSVHAFPLPGDANRMTILSSRSGSALRLIAWSAGKAIAYRGKIETKRMTASWRTVYFSQPISLMIAKDIDNDGTDDIVCVAVKDTSLFAARDLNQDTLKPEMTVRLPYLPTAITSIESLPGRNPDLLLFQNGSPGILPVFGFKSRKLSLGPAIAADLPVGAIAACNLNDDGIMDIVAYDWVQQELHLLYGVGRGRFLDQTTFTVENGISQFLVTASAGQEMLDFVLVDADSSALHIWHGDGFGDFRLHASHRSTGMIRTVRSLDLNGDGWPDVAYLDSRNTMHIVYMADEEEMADGPEVAAGMFPSSFEFTSSPEAMAVVLDEAGKRILVFERSKPRRLVDSLQFVTGLDPSVTLMGDLNRDHRADIVIATSGSHRLELLLSDSAGALEAASSLRIQGGPGSVGLASISDSSAKFIITYPDTRAISFLSYNLIDESHSEAVIPDVGVLEPLAPVKSLSGRIAYYSFGAPGESETPSLSLFQQLQGSQFIERSFRLTVPDVLMGVAVADFDGDGATDVAYVFKNALTGRYDFVTAYGDSTGEFSRRGTSTQLVDSVVAKSYLYVTDVNNDSLPDLLLCFPRTARTISLAQGREGGTFGEVSAIGENIGFAQRSQLQLVDVDHDGNIDIVVNDPVRGEVGFLKGHGNGEFDAWKMIHREDGITHFGFGDFNADGRPDLVVVFRSEGIAKIYDNGVIIGR